VASERDYVLGTHDEEIARLGLQHRVWRPVVLDCWEKAGITVGSRVLDVGAGPGYATVDLAEIVGPKGGVVAIERSGKFVRSMEEACRVRSLTNVRIHELDLMTDDLPAGHYDFSWCRWVLSFVSDPALLIKKIGGVLRTGGFALFHEYADYATWRFAPSRPHQQKFVERVMQSWRDAGGKADIALDLPPLLSENGFVVRSATPRIFCVRPSDYMWQWPAAFIESGPARLKEMDIADEQFAEKLRAELREAEKEPNSLLLTPLVLEIVAEKR
jgi:SAM-dependent methyltransferase